MVKTLRLRTPGNEEKDKYICCFRREMQINRGKFVVSGGKRK